MSMKEYVANIRKRDVELAKAQKQLNLINARAQNGAVETAVVKQAKASVEALWVRKGFSKDFHFLAPLMGPFLEKNPGLEVEYGGPFGVGARYSVSIYDRGLGSDDGLTHYMHLSCYGEEVSWVDFSRQTGKYPDGSMGALNGLNYEEVDLSPDITDEELVQLVERSKVSEKQAAKDGKGDLDALRQQADEAFESYEFGDGVTVQSHDSWNVDDPLDLTKIVYVSFDDDQPDDPTEKLSFHVRFDASGAITETYALSMRNGGEVGRPGAAPDVPVSRG